MPPTSPRASLLAALPDHVRARLDLDELAPPSPALEGLVAGLDERLDAHVVAYRADRPEAGTARRLCTLVEPALLAEPEIAALRHAEASRDDVVLVAYARPLRLRG